MNNNPQDKFLIIRLSSIGDIVLSSALIRSLRLCYPQAKISFLVNKPFKEIVEHNPHIDDIILYDRTKSIAENNTLKEIIINNYNIIDLQNNIRSKKICKGSANSIAKMDKNRLQKLCMVWLKRIPSDVMPIPLRYIETAHQFGVKYDGKGLELWLPEEKQQNEYPPNKKNIKLPPRKIAIAPGAKHYTKRWLPEYFISLIDKLSKKYDAEFYVLGGVDDADICREIAKSNAKISDYSGQNSLLATVRYLDECDLLISNDSSIMHIGAARNVPIVSLFGSTVPQFGFAPFEVKNIICSIDMRCKPCTHIGRKKCPREHFNCMKLLTPDIVFAVTDELIGTHYE